MAALDQLNPRERQMLTGLAITFAALFVILVPLQLSSYLSKLEKQNEEKRQAISDVLSGKGRVQMRKAGQATIAARYRQKAPPLSQLIDQASNETKLAITSTSEVTPIPRGKNYSERATKISIQKTNLKPLVLFLEKIENSGYPISIVHYDMSKRLDKDLYTVNLTIAAFDRIDQPKTASSTGSP